MFVPLALAETKEVHIGTVGETVIGETVTGGGKYFVGVGRTVSVGSVDTFAFVAGETVSFVGDVNGDVYAIGKVISIMGNVHGGVYALGQQLTISGQAKKVAAWAEKVVVEGNVEELNCDCKSVVIEKGAHVGVLSGEARRVRIEGQVLANNIRIKEPQREAQTPASKAKEFVAGLVSMLVLAFALNRWRKWSVSDLKDVRTYIYGVAALAAPIVLFVVFLISLVVADLGVLFGAILGLEIAAFGVWLTALMAAGVPVYDILGREILKMFGKENYYANVALGYTLCFLVSLAFPIWIIVAAVGLGLLIVVCMRKR